MMNRPTARPLTGFAAGLLLAYCITAPAMSDDTEIFTGGSDLGSGVPPNIVFIFDTSGSMSTELTIQIPYDAGEIFPGDCDPGMIYFSKDGDPPDECEKNDDYFAASKLRCDAAAAQIAANGNSALDYMAFWEVKDKPKDSEWKQLKDKDESGLVECAADSGTHGASSGDGKTYAADGLDGPWTDDPAKVVEWGDGDTKEQYVLYAGNYLNWTETSQSVTTTRLQVVKDVTKAMLDNLNGANVGLMRFSNNPDVDSKGGEGGMVIHAVEPIALGRDAIKTKIDALAASGWTPLSEALYEAALYFRGEDVDFGRDSRGNTGQVMPSVAEARTGPGADGGDRYLSPVSADAPSCQKNFIVLLTDGEPTRDTSADSKVATLSPPSFASTTGRAGCDGSGDGRCLDDIAEYLHDADLNDDGSDGKQNVTTHTIGFAIDLPILEETAARGGGSYFTADDAKSLETALLTIVTDILDDNTSFVAPTISVNAFNRVETAGDLFLAVFQADSRPLWRGNLKKYRLVGDVIVGKDGTTPVVDPASGFFSDTAESMWSTSADGADATAGGAASRLGDPATRRLFVNMAGDFNIDLTDGAAELDTGNSDITSGVLGVAAADITRDELIAFARGADILDEDDDGDTTEPRRFMGDPLHAKPVSVVYGGTAGTPDPADAVVFMATNEGFLHAIDAGSGEELWAFMPRQLLPRLLDWYENDSGSSKGYGLDGELRVRVADSNGNGVVEPASGDKVVLYFGMRRGGNRYFAVDVTDRDAPVLLWSRGAADYPLLGQTWSPPSITRVDIQGAAQNAEQAVLVFGGGYDESQDAASYSTDGSGTGIYIVDADSGALLWRAGPDAGADLQMTAMNNAIPAGIRVLDMNGDGFADRMYAGDMGGRLWRLDLFNGQAPATLAGGAVIASLGAADLTSPTNADNRRFYNTPDVSLIRRESGSYLSVAIGSGYRAHPLETDTADSFYSIRDYSPFRQLSNPEYAVLESNMVVHDDARLENITGTAGGTPPTVPAGAMGWRLDFPPGEKVLAASRTFREKVVFTTYSPESSGNALSCVPQRGTSRIYIVMAEDGKPDTNLDEEGSDDALTVEDRNRILKQSGIAPEVAFLFTAEPEPAPEDGEEPDPDCYGASVRPRCLVGLESCPADFCNAPVRTFWTQDDATELE